MASRSGETRANSGAVRTFAVVISYNLCAFTNIVYMMIVVVAGVVVTIAAHGGELTLWMFRQGRCKLHVFCVPW